MKPDDYVGLPYSDYGIRSGIAKVLEVEEWWMILRPDEYAALLNMEEKE